MTVRRTDRQKKRQKKSLTVRRIDIPTERQTDCKNNSQKDIQTDRQKDKQRDQRVGILVSLYTIIKNKLGDFFLIRAKSMP